MRTRLPGAGLLLLLCVSGCKVGPNFEQPKWTNAPASWVGRETKQAKVPSQPVAAPIDPEWWNIFHDPKLTALEAKVAASNLDVLAAAERVMQSRAELGVTAAALYPVVNANASMQKVKASNEGILAGVGNLAAGSAANGASQASSANGASGSLGPGGVSSAAVAPNISATNLFQYGFDANWELDLWGRVQRSVEAANAAVNASVWSARGVLISALAEVARDYINLRGTQEQLRIAHESVKTAEQGLTLTRQRAAAGVTTDLDVANAAAQVRTTEAQIPALESQQQSLINALSLLLGEPPRTLEAELAVPDPVPPPPPLVPVGFPSELARRRPDIRAAEATLHEAVANIGVAEASFYPTITLGGSGGFQALHANDLFGWNARQWAIGPGLTLPIFQGGQLRYTLQLRQAQQREAAIAYEKTVLNAWSEVDNALTAFRDEQRRRAELEQAVAENRRALSLAQQRYQQGVADFLSVLDAERSLLSTQQQLASSTTAVSSDLVALYNALGGGWNEPGAATVADTGS
ncbi:MAG TPA: efflux transporter outer membrane subunit [Acetobacteraceae bacterium]|nr:efflux transporter outer membrane subunit [Acetobacteraceae bacterium]